MVSNGLRSRLNMADESELQRRREVYELGRRDVNLQWRIAFWIAVIISLVIGAVTSGSLFGILLVAFPIVVFTGPLRDCWRERRRVGRRLAELGAAPSAIQPGPLLVGFVTTVAGGVLAAVIGTLIND